MVMKRRVPGILENLLKNKEETRYANLAYVSIVLLTILGSKTAERNENEKYR